MASDSLARRILIVEDHVDAAELLERYARLLNYDTRICHTVQQALEQALAFLPQIILLDIGLRSFKSHRRAG